MQDIIAAQQVQRRSKPSLLSTAQKYRAVPDNSFITDQHLPKRKKKRRLEKIRSSAKGQILDNAHNLHLTTKRNPLSILRSPLKNPFAGLTALFTGRPRTFQETAPEEKPLPEKIVRERPSPGKLILGIVTGLAVICLALVIGIGYIPDPEPPEDAVIREHNGTAAADGGDEIPLDLTETFAWLNYTVKSGDSVEAISRRFGLSLDAVIASNNLRNVRQLRAGERIRIPNMDGIPYLVKNGDSYAKIAASLDVPLEAILDANDIQNDTINAGAVLFIPGAKMDKTALRQALGELFIWPLSGRRNSGFGWRNDPFTKVRSFHAGLDISASTGTAVKASADGRVTATGYNGVYGNFIIISHADNYQTMYAHLNKILVRKGANVNQGAVIAQSGNSGRSTGPHLHFSVYKNDRAINPLEVLNK